jgi:hypothetical protein
LSVVETIINWKASPPKKVVSCVIKSHTVSAENLEAIVSMPEDKKFNFEKLSLSDDLTDSLEPINEGESEQLSQEQKAEVPPEEEPKTAAHESHVGKREAVPPTSKFKDLVTKLSAANPFTVMLAVAVAALFIAILCCIIELGRYHFQISAKKAINSVTVSANLDSVCNVV